MKNPGRGVPVLGAVAVVMIAAVTILIIVELHAREGRAARDQLKAFDTLLAEQTARTVDGVDLVVSQVAEDLRHNGISTAESLEALKDDPVTFLRLRERIANLPQFDALTLVSHTGQLINMSRYIPVPDVNIADREYFKTLQAAPSLLTTISTPLQNRGTGTWNIYFARRLTGHDGAFVGLVLGAMQQEYFEHLYETISLAGSTSISLWREDGSLLARYPPPKAAGQIVKSQEYLRTLPTGETTIGTAQGDLGGASKMFALRKLPKNGLVVEVAKSLDDVFGDWRHDAAIVGVAGTICGLAVALVTLMLLRQFRAYDAMSSAVAAREQAVAARQHAEARLVEAEKMEAIGRLTSGIAHDFNNLLASVAGNVELLLRDGSAEETASRRLTVIQQAADRGTLLVRQLLAFSRQQILSPMLVSLNQAVDGMLTLIEGVVGPRVVVVNDIDPSIWPVLVDPTQFEYMVLNVAVNARDAMADGGTLTIAARNVVPGAARPEGLPAGHFVAITLSDTGVGMATEVLRQAFDPFFTTKPPGRGSGLGLSQVYGLATQSGGLATLQSTPGSGTTVTVFLPRAVEVNHTG